MCISPNFVWVQRGPQWEQQPVACRQCWRCKQNRLNDYVGRSMCEAHMSMRTCVINLTYAPRSDLADKVLEPYHWQLFMKLLRRAGHKVRYLVVGEYGKLKARSHFHAILFFQEWGSKYPNRPAFYNPGHVSFPDTSERFSHLIPNKRMVHIREWPHGHITVDWSASEASMRYVCKYLLSEDKDNAWFSLSKKPALGAQWFAMKAEKARQYGVLPSSFEYSPPGGTEGRPYLMTGATRRDYLNAITQDEGDLPRMSEWVGKSFEKQAKQRAVEAAEGLPLEEQEAAMRERFVDLQERLDIHRMRQRMTVDKLLDQSATGMLLRWRGGWATPQEIERQKDVEKKTGKLPDNPNRFGGWVSR